MIGHETAIHKVTVELKLQQVPLQPSIMNLGRYHNVSCKRPSKYKNLKLYIKHDHRPDLLKNGERVRINVYMNNDNHWTTCFWLRTGT